MVTKNSGVCVCCVCVCVCVCLCALCVHCVCVPPPRTTTACWKPRCGQVYMNVVTKNSALVGDGGGGQSISGTLIPTSGQEHALCLYRQASALLLHVASYTFTTNLRTLIPLLERSTMHLCILLLVLLFVCIYSYM